MKEIDFDFAKHQLLRIVVFISTILILLKLLILELKSFVEWIQSIFV